ncbi:MAG: hypothetical protein ABII10_02020 [Candidatus Paceibacterota bacterium]
MVEKIKKSTFPLDLMHVVQEGKKHTEFSRRMDFLLTTRKTSIDFITSSETNRFSINVEQGRQITEVNNSEIPASAKPMIMCVWDKSGSVIETIFISSEVRNKKLWLSGNNQINSVESVVVPHRLLESVVSKIERSFSN